MARADRRPIGSLAAPGLQASGRCDPRISSRNGVKTTKTDAKHVRHAALMAGRFPDVARHGKLPPRRHEELPPQWIAEERANERTTNHGKPFVE
ncbi:MAG: hypothetical protein EOQ70_21085 [Mesorhizobium sp.]|nr:MAG: hypothetical protein EOQ28_19250 [Mesorhizobium sp.]RWB93421.1 MAG: hypothetical protein EOQ57_34310 [Mesorhizobium sp.]RWG83330.1 MAG: hypothetical protein EOQ70_21085 [Mesorhizobium sp.]RWK14326.1 MAG: hypothetical protein EOR41_28205 [Mesorhizobium sp.]